MKYVSMHEVAFDPTDIVFPGLGHCHGVVYQTNVGFFAMHIFGGAQDTSLKADLFARFVQSHDQGADAQGVCLYGACPTVRFGGVGAAGQRDELQACARALGWAGPIEGAMWDLAQMGWNTTYVEFERSLAGNVRIRIEDFTNGQIPTAANPDHPNQKLTRRQLIGANAYGGQLLQVDNVVLAPIRMMGVPNFMINSAPL